MERTSLQADVKQFEEMLERAERLQRAAKDALAVQDASNISGVTVSLVEAIRAIRGNGGTTVRSNPIITLFLSKLGSLNGSDCLCSRCLDAYAAASREVERLAGKEVRP